jgi:tight adherence protein B
VTQPATASALEGLAELAEVHGSIRRALIAWGERAPEELGSDLRRLSARLSLGAPISHALSTLTSCFGADAAVLKAVVRAHLSSGAAVPPLLRAMAARITFRAETERRMAAGLAGVKASARLVAALPVVCLALFPMERSPLSDPTGLVLVAVGLLLTAAGFVWMRRVVPTIRSLDDPIGDMVQLVAAALRAGCPSGQAFELGARCPLGASRRAVERAQRMARLGSRWSSALNLTGDPTLKDLALVVDRCSDGGTPLAPALDRWVATRRERAAVEMERAMRQAPVRMLLPLTLCVLPSFVLLGLGPFVRELVRSV